MAQREMKISSLSDRSWAGSAQELALPSVGNSAEEGHLMSKKRKLESLQQLGVLKPNDVKAIQAKLNPAHRVEQSWITLHNVRWVTLGVVLGLGWAGIAAALGVAWRLSH